MSFRIYDNDGFHSMKSALKSKMTIGEIKDMLGFKKGIWTHPKNQFLRQTYLVNGNPNEEFVIDLTNCPVLKIVLASPYD